MAALGPELAAEVIQHLRQEEIESLSLEMTKLGAIEEHTTEAILGELAAAAGTDGPGDVVGGVEFAREVLEARSAPSAPRSCSRDSQAPTRRARSSS